MIVDDRDKQVGECFFWYWLTRVVQDNGPYNGCSSSSSYAYGFLLQ